MIDKNVSQCYVFCKGICRSDRSDSKGGGDMAGKWGYEQDDLSDLDKEIPVFRMENAKPRGRAAAYSSSSDTGFLNGSAAEWRECYVTMALIALNVLVFLAQLLISAETGRTFVDLFDSLANKSWWGTAVYLVFLSTFIHGSWYHIIGNTVFLWFCGVAVEKRFSRRRVLITYFVGGIVASAASIFYNGAVLSIGSSGAIAALLGAYLFKKIFWSDAMDGYTESSWAPVIELYLCYVVLMVARVLFDTSEGVDVAAHVGGLVAGILLSFVFMIIDYHNQS